MDENAILRTVLKNNPDPIYFKNRDAHYTEVSASMLHHLQLEREEVQGKTDFDIFPDKKAQEMYEEDIRVMQNNEPINGKVERITWPDGKTQWLSVYKFPRHNSKGKVVGTFGLLKDITEYKETEREFEGIKKQAVLMAEQSGNLMYRIDKNFKCMYANQKTLTYLDSSEEEVIGSKFTEFLPEKDKKEFIEHVERAIESGEAVKLEHKWNISDCWLYTIFTPVPDPDTGEIVDVLAISRDITRAKKAEERQEFLHSLLRHDLRNKIQIIQGYLQFLEDTDTSEEQEKFLKKAIKASRNGYDLIEEVRALRKTKKDHKPIEINVGAIISKVIDENRDRAQ